MTIPLGATVIDRGRHASPGSAAIAAELARLDREAATLAAVRRDAVAADAEWKRIREVAFRAADRDRRAAQAIRRVL